MKLGGKPFVLSPDGKECLPEKQGSGNPEETEGRRNVTREMMDREISYRETSKVSQRSVKEGLCL